MSKRVALGGVLTATAIIFSYIEFLFPLELIIPIPGLKLGLANIVVVVILYKLGVKYALAVNLLRIFLVAWLFTSPLALLFALCGGLLSLLAMWLLKSVRVFSVAGVSIAGGVTHNIGQILVASLLMGSAAVFNLLPYLLITGAITGALIGVLAGNVLKRLPEI
ncbi:MAG: Gx transporter family protein [Clostridiales bacterium]|nr:Gx transporter family protein [Clostridiales bacterium]